MFIYLRSLVIKPFFSFISKCPRFSSVPKKEIIINELELDEKFIKGGGPGGQKINKTSSCVQLKHIPTGITIKTQRFRELQSNRKEARKLLMLALDDLVNGKLSKRNVKADKEREKKLKQKSRSKKKHSKGNTGIDETTVEVGSASPITHPCTRVPENAAITAPAEDHSNDNYK